jgi:hypothetical protein
LGDFSGEKNVVRIEKIGSEQGKYNRPAEVVDKKGEIDRDERKF